MLRLFTAIVLVFPLIAAAQERPSSSDIIQQQVEIGLTPIPCLVPGAARRIALAIGEPAGIEYIPGSCDVARPGPPRESMSLMGLPAREALDRLVQLDPRYRWIETDGVIVVRPIAAWDDPKHFLHRTASSFTVDDQPLGGAVNAVLDALGWEHSDLTAPPFGGRTPDAIRHFSVGLGATSIIEALNAVARTHSAFLWSVAYCRPEAREEYADILLMTFDGSGSGGHHPFLRDAAGKYHDPCSGRPPPRAMRPLLQPRR